MGGDALSLYARNACKLSESQRAYVLALCATTHSSDHEVDAADREQTGRPRRARKHARDCKARRAAVDGKRARAHWLLRRRRRRGVRGGAVPRPRRRATQQPGVGCDADAEDDFDDDHEIGGQQHVVLEALCRDVLGDVLAQNLQERSGIGARLCGQRRGAAKKKFRSSCVLTSCHMGLLTKRRPHAKHKTLAACQRPARASSRSPSS